MDEGALEVARREFERVEEHQKKEGFEVVWVIVDGFVLYWDPVRLILSDCHCLSYKPATERVADMLGDRGDVGYQTIPEGSARSTPNTERRTSNLRTPK